MHNIITLLFILFIFNAYCVLGRAVGQNAENVLLNVEHHNVLQISCLFVY